MNGSSPETWIALTAVFVICLLGAEALHRPLGVWIFKPLASLGFVATALSAGGTESGFGRCILAGLLLSFVGDVLLIPKSRGAFKAGIASFLLGHVFFAISFVVFSIKIPYALAGAIVVIPGSSGIARWLLPHVTKDLKVSVLLYVLVISAMVIFAAGSVPTDSSHLLLPAAVAFFISDLSVARDRFVKKAFFNRLWGLPLYYAAQLLFAWSAGMTASR